MKLVFASFLSWIFPLTSSSRDGGSSQLGQLEVLAAKLPEWLLVW